MTVDGLKIIFDWVAVILLFLTFAAGLGALVTGSIINKRQEVQLRQFDKDLTNAKERAAANEREAAELRKQAEDERMARTQLAAAISWRAPDRELVPTLAPTLKAFAGQRFCFITDISDPERLGVLSWISVLLGAAEWKMESAHASARPEIELSATNIVLWISPAAPENVVKATHALVPVLEHAGLDATAFQSAWGPPPDAAPPELMRVVIFKKGPRMVVTGNKITFEDLPTEMLFGPGPPH